MFDAAGKLTQIIFADGYTQTLVYAGTLNTRVIDSRGRWLNFIYAPAGSAWAGLLLVAQGSDGKLVRYGYDDRSRAGLDPKFRSKTTGSGQWALRLVSYPPSTPASSYAPTTTYEYLDNRHRPYLITTVTNRPSAQPSTWVTTRWTYDVKKRVTSAERFVRLDSSRTKPGNGLGLSLVSGVMKLHKGALLLEDNNPGLAARLVLPLHRG